VAEASPSAQQDHQPMPLTQTSSTHCHYSTYKTKNLSPPINKYTWQWITCRQAHQNIFSSGGDWVPLTKAAHCFILAVSSHSLDHGTPIQTVKPPTCPQSAHQDRNHFPIIACLQAACIGSCHFAHALPTENSLRSQHS
jgi:hypothetical protein